MEDAMNDISEEEVLREEVNLLKIALDQACRRVNELNEQMETITETHHQSLRIIESLRAKLQKAG
jgi:hypothetical protein